MKKLKIIIVIALGVFAFNSCETTELDNMDNPNALNPTQADVDLYMNGIQVRFASTVHQIQDPAAELTRITNMFGRSYADWQGPSNFNAEWQNAYTIINDLRKMNAQAQELGLTKHIAVGKVLEAYLMVTLVDMWGEVPYSEAFDPNNLNPAPDSGEAIYEAARNLLDEAITEFQAEGGGKLQNDFYYGNNFENWIRAANTIKMKTYIQTRLVDNGAIAAFEAIEETGNYIKTNKQNFVFNWGSNLDNPNSRHPYYNGGYGPGGTSGYRSNWLLNLMKNEYEVTDPRMRYYFYRQVDDVLSNVDPESGAELQCTQYPIPPHYEAGGYVFCVIPDDEGYWGRDHGDNAGLPPDGFLQTAFGVYPAGGKFDDNSFEQIDSNDMGANGEGVTPIILASIVDFWKAEIAIVGGNGVPAEYLADGVTKNIEYVMSFISRDDTADTDFVPSDEQVATYVDDVVAEMTGASTQEKLNVLGEQLFIAAYGNAIPAYNYYRRTGAPTDIQPNIEPNPGPFVRSFWYPANEVTANANLDQKAGVDRPVFWDNNPQSGFPPNN